MTIPFLIAAALVLPTCRQTVTVDCPSAQDARDLTAEIVQLGEGERFVFSGRWDDRNLRALPLCRALAPTGFRSTFYVNGASGKEYTPILREEVASGCSIGCHTISHNYMGRLLPTKNFREILQNRIELEVDSQSPVVTLGMPYGQGSAACAAAGFDNVKVVGEAAQNAGLLGGAEGDSHSAAAFGFGDDEWVGSFVFRANDQKPDAKLFAQGFAKGTNLVARGQLPCGPHFTLGVHPWQKDDGLVDLAAMVKEAVAVPGVVLMNENEYVASRLQALRSTVRKAKTEGKKVRFEIVRPCPAALGAAVPMNLKLSDGRYVKVAPPKNAPVPTAFARLDGALSASPDDSSFTLAFTNATDKAMRDVSFALRLPPGYAPGVVEKKVASIAPGKDVKVVFKSRVPEKPLFREGTLYAAVEINWAGNRVWAPLEKKRGTGAKLPCPRDMALFSGPVRTAEAPSAEVLQAMSVPGAERTGDWQPCGGLADEDAAWAVTGYTQRDRNRVRKLVGWGGTPAGQGYDYILMFDFEADVSAHGETWKYVFAGGHVQKKHATLWLNGEALEKPFGGEVKLRAGLNRLLVRITDVDADMFYTILAINSAKDGTSAKFVGR